MRTAVVILAVVMTAWAACARPITLTAHDRPAEEVFKELMAQSDKNFVYPAGILSGITVTVDAEKQSLRRVLRQMFKDTDIDFKIKGNIVTLRRKTNKVSAVMPDRATVSVDVAEPSDSARMLREVVVTSRLEAPAVEAAEMGAKKLTAKEILSVPVLFGEADVVKAIQFQPGVAEGVEGMAGLYVHGGNADENLYMLDNVPLYQVNHFGGFFSAFNIDAIRYIDFFKTSIPAKYDGRLSSFLDVRTANGNPFGHHGSAKLGLTSGAFNISGPVGAKTTYSFALRRSWYDVLTIPFLALINAASDDEKIRFRYDFMDINAKIHHRFGERTSAWVSIYSGYDGLHTGDKSGGAADYGFYYDEKYDFYWGNLLTQLGLMQRFGSNLTAEFTLAYTRYFSTMDKSETTTEKSIDEVINSTSVKMKSNNDINNWIARSDWSWQPRGDMHVRFGAGFTLHSFLPEGMWRQSSINNTVSEWRNESSHYMAGETNVYVEDDWRIDDRWHVNAGLHGSLFKIDGRYNGALSPRLSANCKFSPQWAAKIAYARTTQYVHRLSQSYLALPTDQWVPVMGDFKPEHAEKVSAGVYWQSLNKMWTVSAEAYWKEMRNLVDYRDEYYLLPLPERWNARLTSGRGTAKGIDFKIEKTMGPVTGHVAYSLAWSDRTFAHKNGGKTFPAQFDNRHSIKVLLNWEISKKLSLSAAWTGHSGNRFTLLTQSWQQPPTDIYGPDEAPLQTDINNYQLPFYHRLDLSLKLNNKRGYWTFGLYNAYCHMNAIAVRRGSREVTEIIPGGVAVVSRPAFQKVSLFPIIPSIAYTWIF